MDYPPFQQEKGPGEPDRTGRDGTGGRGQRGVEESGPQDQQGERARPQDGGRQDRDVQQLVHPANGM